MFSNYLKKVNILYLFYRMNFKSSIFTSGEATSENTTLVLLSEVQIDLALEKSNFLFLLCFKIAITCTSHQNKDTIFSSRSAPKLMLPIVFTGYDKHSFASVK